MASAGDSDLREDLKCPKCTKIYDEPKVVGSCKHSFCKECLQTFIQEEVRGDEFQCPLCEQKCRVPQNGVDGFPTNLHLIENIIKKFNQMKWNRCSCGPDEHAEASFCCPKCGNVSLCDDCVQRHSNHPRTKCHDVISLCELHGRPLDQFCTNCNCPICAACLFSTHYKEEPCHVIDYKERLQMKKSELGEGLKKVQAATKPLQAQQTELQKQLTEKSVAFVKIKENAVANFNIADTSVTKAILECSTQAEYYRSQLELMERKKMEHERRKERLQKIKQPFFHALEQEQQKDERMIQNTIKNVTDLQDEIQATGTKCDELLSEKRLKADLDENITRTYTSMMEISDASKKDWAMPFRERTISSDDYSFCEEYVTSAGLFSSASISYSPKVRNGSSVYSVAFISNYRIAASVKVDGCYKVFLWKLPYMFLGAKVIMQEEAIIPYITALGQDNLVVLRLRSPILTVMDVIKNKKREIDVKLSDEAMRWLWSVEAVSHGNFLVSYKEASCVYAVLVDSVGKVLRAIETGTGYRLAFCRITGIVVVCTHSTDTISCYQLGENSLTEVMSAPHGVTGFICHDICSGTLGELFVVGVMRGGEPNEVRLYQPDPDADKKTVSMKQIIINGEQMRAKGSVKCSVKGHRLVIGYDDKVHVLDLLV